jgi:plasmid stabilization system protein ParE
VSAPRRLLLSPRAAADLEDIAGYIARDNPQRAMTFVEELEAKCRAVAVNPQIYPARPDLRPWASNGGAWPLSGVFSQFAGRERSTA